MPRPNLALGARFGRYVVLGSLGRGGLGEVLKARDSKLDREVALKVVHLGSPAGASEETVDPTNGGGLAIDAHAPGESPDDPTPAPPERDELLREARAAAAIEHPNVISIFEIGEIDGTAFLTMELIVGDTLRVWARRASIVEKVRALSTVARALAAAHARGVVHRDVKPENVMMRDDGVLKVLDFGIARRVHGSLDPHGANGAIARRTLTRTDEWGFAGTPAYMAPEQLRGERLDARCDQFAWGVMAYELLAGRAPWPGGDAIAVVSQILESPAPPLDGPGLVGGVDAIVARALAKDRTARFDAMSDVADALDAALAPTAPERPLRRVPPWSIPFAALALGMLVTAFTSAPTRPPTPVKNAVAAKRTGPAAEAYDAGKRELREASLVEARRDFARATEIDPTFAAAHLWQALLAADLDDAMHASLALAVKHRATLSANEAAILQAVEPWLQVPVDWPESEKRLIDAAAHASNGAELAFVLGRARYHQSDDEGALAAFSDAQERDPGLAVAWLNQGLVFVHRGDGKASDHSFHECLAVSPGSTSCLGELALNAGMAGLCGEEAVLARRLSVLEPDTAEWLFWRGQALVSEDPFSTEAELAFEKAWRLLPAPERKTTEIGHRASLALVRGDFAAAARYAEAWEEAADATTDAFTHLAPARTRMQIALEQGDRSGAASLAERFLRRQSAWVVDDGGWGNEIYALGIRYRAGALDRRAFQKARDAWLDKESPHAARLGRRQLGLLWVIAYAANAVTRDDAEEALDALRAYGPLPSALDIGLVGSSPIGEVYRLAGDRDASLAWLRRAGGSCQAIDYPILWVQSKLSLGLAEEAAGNVRAACEAYAHVLSSWGRVDRSSTAAAARKRHAALACSGAR